MGQLSRLQINEDKAFQNVIVENKVDKEVFPIECESLLTAHKGESPPQLQKEFLQMVDQGLLQVAFIKAGVLFQAEKFQHIWVADNIFR